MRRTKSGMNIFMLAGASIAFACLLIAAAVFAYEFYLKSAHVTKTAQLEEAQKAVNIDTVEDFIRLRNRLTALESLLDHHVILSEFFDVLETRTLQSVRFSGLTVAVDTDRSAEIQMEGVARSFNALAAQSTQFAAEKRIKRAIFSDIAVNTNGTVAFSLTATVDPRLITSAEVLPGISEPEALPAATNIVPATIPGTLPVATTTTIVPRATTTAPAIPTIPVVPAL
jgi:hypothetical protein